MKMHLNLLYFTDSSGILLAVDFEKSFDSLNYSFLLKIQLRNTIYKWIKTFYTNVSSCVLNNGFITNLFDIRCGVRQGDPLSPLLFILAIEELARRIRDDKGIKGILINEEEIKLTLFADYMTYFFRDIASHHRLLATLYIFLKKFFNLRVNNDKTEIFAIGRHHLDPT